MDRQHARHISTWMQGRVHPAPRGHSGLADLLLMAGRILSMQTGFAMLESAYARPMNSANIMMKNLLDLLLGALVFYLFGYEIAFGRQSQLDGSSHFDFALWFLHFAYATTSATISSGALAGRVAFIPYLLLSTMITGIIYPVAVRWTWGGGWLNDWGYTDFAGSSIVHLVGAVSACVAVCICGPRIGKYPQFRPWKGISRKVFAEHNEKEYYEMPCEGAERAIYAHIKAVSNPVQLLFGIFLLITGFLAFNPAATFSTIKGSDLLGARTTVVTLLMTAGGSLACFAASLVRTRSLVVSVPDLTTAVLGSMVSSCACCNVLPPLIGVLVGFLAGLLALWFQWWLNEHQIDDVVGAAAAHGPPAVWGVVSVALWARPHCHSSLRGLAFGGGAEAVELLGIQFAGLLALTGFATVSVYVAVVVIDAVFGFRCSRASELIGLDFMAHRFDDGSFGTDPNKITVISESVMRECLAQRVVRNLSPTKSYAFPNSPFKMYSQDHPPSSTHGRPADNTPSTSPDEANAAPPGEIAGEPGKARPLERPPCRRLPTSPVPTSRAERPPLAPLAARRRRRRAAAGSPPTRSSGARSPP
ncbi:unnamed protein product [Prorocentrum cordatum]|uniref:Ammonium transporter AmtB-like domain-containing protein n=1 Tax=Prorocentrum cordatum TaxID=2364126 RepID=A0ABN9UJC7_9DINO|nr:unnamed protein product [Polarella glacialis]